MDISTSDRVYENEAIPAKFMKHPTLIPELETLARQFIKNWDK